MLPNIAAFIALVEKLVETAAEATSLLSVAVPPSQISPLVTSVEKVVADLEYGSDPQGRGSPCRRRPGVTCRSSSAAKPLGFGGPDDHGVKIDEGLALVDRTDFGKGLFKGVVFTDPAGWHDGPCPRARDRYGSFYRLPLELRADPEGVPAALARGRRGE